MCSTVIYFTITCHLCYIFINAVGYRETEDKSEAGDKSEFQKLFGDNYRNARRMWRYCRLWSRNVEVVYKAKNGHEILTKVYFPYDPHVS